jgi:hypothetical protein
MEEAIEEFEPNFIIYNAGTDVLINDPLGGLDISEDVISGLCLHVQLFESQFNIQIYSRFVAGHHTSRRDDVQIRSETPNSDCNVNFRRISGQQRARHRSLNYEFV